MWRNDYLKEHLPYELSMMQHAFKRMNTTRDPADWNSFLESFCIHARNLKSLVTNDRGKGSNGVIAKDFCEFDRRVLPELTGAFQRLNEQISHLAKNRTVDPKKKFSLVDAGKVCRWLEAAMRDFIASLGTEDRKLWDTALRNTEKMTVDITTSSLAATNVIQSMTYTTSPPDPQGFRIIHSPSER